MIRFPKRVSPIKSVSWGITHVLALTQNGEVYTWGSGANYIPPSHKLKPRYNRKEEVIYIPKQGQD